MKIRDGFVTNSSSTNFLIITKEELTQEYLLNKLGIKDNSPLRSEFVQLCDDIVKATKFGISDFDINSINSENILKVFGKKSAEKYKHLVKKGYFVYIGDTPSDSSGLTSFFTTDCFEYEHNGIYINGLNCIW